MAEDDNKEKTYQNPFFLVDQLPQEHISLIGQITFDFSKIEFLLIEIINKGFKISTRSGRIIFSIMNVHDRIKVALQDIWWIIVSFVFACCERIATGKVKGKG